MINMEKLLAMYSTPIVAYVALHSSSVGVWELDADVSEVTEERCVFITIYGEGFTGNYFVVSRYLFSYDY